MRKMKKLLAGVMSAVLLLTNCPIKEKLALAAEADTSVATATDAEADNSVTVYKGAGYSFGGHQSNWYSTNEKPNSGSVNAYSIVSGYEMTENSITAEAESVTDKNLIKAVYYSYAAPGYCNNQTAMEALFLACNAVTEEERAGVSYLLISGYADDVYNLESKVELTTEEQEVLDNVRLSLKEMPSPTDDFQVYVVNDKNTTNVYDLVFWQENGSTLAELEVADEPQLAAAGVTEENYYWQDMKAWIHANNMLIEGAAGYGSGDYSATGKWSCAGWVSRVIYYALGETDVAKAHNQSVSGLQIGFLEPSDKFERLYNMVGNRSGTGCTNYGTPDEAAMQAGYISANGGLMNSATNAKKAFINLVDEGKIKAGDIIIFYGDGGWLHAAIMGDGYTSDGTPTMYNALSTQYGSTSDTPVSTSFTGASNPKESGVGFAIYRYQSYGFISLTKKSGEEDITGNKNHADVYDLSGAVYKVENSDGTPVGLFETDSKGNGVVVSSAEDANGNIIEVSLENNSDEGGETLTVRLGNYTVTEIKAPANGSYKINTISQEVSVTDDSIVKVNDTDYISTAKVKVTKKSSNPDITEGNSCYSLKGAKYTIYEADGETVARYITKKDKNGKIIETKMAENLETDENGNLPELEFPFGTYYVQEKGPSKGYDYAECYYGINVHNKKLDVADKVYEIICEEPPLDDPINIRIAKWDGEKINSSPSAGGSLENAYFTVRFYNNYYTNIDKLPKEATRTWVIKTIFDEKTKCFIAALDEEHFVSGDKLYRNELVTLPLGTVTVEETKAPEGYKLLVDGGKMWDINGEVDSATFIGQIKVDSNSDPYKKKEAHLYVGSIQQGNIVTANPLTTTAISVYEQIIRTDLSFSKLDYETRDEMAGIPFKITSEKTGESHIVVTSDTGFYSTNISHQKHTDNTNANDKYLTQDLDSYDDCVESGIWFYGTNDKNEWARMKVDDTKGAVPYDTYIIEELPCKKNEGKQIKFKTTIKIEADKDGKVTNVGVITNTDEPSFSTKAMDKETQSHFSAADEDVTIQDKITYKRLTAGKTYTVKGILMDKNSSDSEEGAKPLLDNNGEVITAKATFTVDEKYLVNPNEKEGEVTVEYSFDGSNLAGETYVIFAYLFEGENNAPLYENGKLNLKGAVTTRDGEVVRHADINDENQTGTFPKIETEARTAKTGMNVSPAEDNVEIHDKISYSGLIPNYEYRIEGVLIDKATGEPITDADGNPVALTKHFTATGATGEMEVTFPAIDATGMEGNATVVYERLYWNNTEYAKHTDLYDTKQSIYYPTIGTQAKDSETDEDRACADNSVTIIDTVTYENLVPGYEYTLEGALMNKRTGKPVTTSDGTPITAEETFTPEDFSGSVDVTFTFDAIDANLEGEAVVCFEILKIKDVELTDHKDITDEGQTIYFPSLKTALRDKDTGIQNTFLNENIELVDTVSYTNLVSGKTYRLEGTLMNKKTGKAVMVDGKPVTATAAFTAENASGTVNVTFTFDGIKAGLEEENELVAFEKLYYEKTEEGEKKEWLIGIHEDIGDIDQTVSIPKIETTLMGKETEDHVSNAGEKITLVDHVAYKGLIPGKTYTMTGTLMTEDEKGEPIELLVDGKPVTAQKIFTPTKSSGTVDVEFTFDATLLAGKHVVAFEDCTYKGKKVAIHMDIHDDDQTVDFPKIHTTAADSETEDHISLCVEEVTIIDTVTFENLPVNKIYTVKGILMNKKTGKPVTDESGKQVTVEAVLNTSYPSIGTAISKDENGNIIETGDSTVITEVIKTEDGKVRLVSGSIKVTFNFNAKSCNLEGVETVVFEELYYNGEVIAEHKEINDGEQTITFGKIQTTAKDKATGTHTSAGGKVTIVDTVAYSGLIPGKNYKLSGVLMDKATGEPLLINGKSLRVEKSFTAKTSDGEEELTFTFDAADLHDRTVVVFETLYYKGKEVALHTDINDKAQSVFFPQIKTMAKDKADGDKQLATSGSVTIVDTVSYTNLAEGETYTLEGVLMDKTTGKPLLVNGNKVTASKNFTPETSDGSVDVEFTFNVSGLKGRELVVFEKIYLADTNILVADHEDINDKDQTVSVTGEHHPKTGDKAPIMVIFLIGVFSLVAGAGVYFVRRRRGREQD